MSENKTKEVSEPVEPDPASQGCELTWQIAPVAGGLLFPGLRYNPENRGSKDRSKFPTRGNVNTLWCCELGGSGLGQVPGGHIRPSRLVVQRAHTSAVALLSRPTQ